MLSVSQNLLLSEFCLVLIWDLKLVELVELLVLDGFNLSLLLLNLLPDLSALLKVVKSLLLRFVLVGVDL
jgi:hypothetical protein